MVTGYAELPSSCLPCLSLSAFPMITTLHLESILPSFLYLIPLYQLWINFLFSGFKLCCIVLCCIILYCIILHCIVLYCIVLSLICCDVIVISDEQSIVWMNLSTFACIGNRQSTIFTYPWASGEPYHDKSCHVLPSMLSWLHPKRIPTITKCIRFLSYFFS